MNRVDGPGPYQETRGKLSIDSEPLKHDPFGTPFCRTQKMKGGNEKSYGRLLRLTSGSYGRIYRGAAKRLSEPRCAAKAIDLRKINKLLFGETSE